MYAIVKQVNGRNTVVGVEFTQKGQPAPDGARWAEKDYTIQCAALALAYNSLRKTVTGVPTNVIQGILVAAFKRVFGLSDDEGNARAYKLLNGMDKAPDARSNQKWALVLNGVHRNFAARLEAYVVKTLNERKLKDSEGKVITFSVVHSFNPWKELNAELAEKYAS